MLRMAHPRIKSGDGRNFHAHLMMTTRAVNSEGLGDKTAIERENKWLAANNLPLTQVQLVEIRQSWEQVANEHLARAGLEVQIDHRSHMERGLEIEPTEHMGVHATQMQRRGQSVSRSRLDSEAARRNAELIREKPEQVLSIVTGEKSVFDRRDVARALHRYIDHPELFQGAFAKAMGSTALVELAPEVRAATGEVLEPARYSTREMVEIERGMVFSAERMSAARGRGVGEGHVEEALAARSYLSDEQQEAVRHITGEEQLAVVVGLAGAGKSSMLSAAREAWEREGYRVHGAALSGKAAEGLEESSGIASRTLASWDYGWQAGRGELGSRDILVIDEAGMVSSKQLARFVGEAERAGAKIVLVGDPEQLQPIQAGAAFRAVAERVGFAELEGVRRQRENWQRQASQDFARHRTRDGLEAYAEKDRVRFSQTRDEARGGDRAGCSQGHVRATGRLADRAGASPRRRSGVERRHSRGASGGRRAFGRAVLCDERRRAAVCAGRPRAVPGEQSRSWGQERDAGNGSGGRGRPACGAARHCAGGGARAGGFRVDGGLRRDRSRLCDDDSQIAGGDGRSRLCAEFRQHGPAFDLCRDDAAPRGGDALRRPRRV